MDGWPGSEQPKDKACGFVEAFDRSTRYSQETVKDFWNGGGDRRGSARQVWNSAMRKLCRLDGLSPGWHNVSVVWSHGLDAKEAKRRGGTKVKLVSLSSC